MNGRLRATAVAEALGLRVALPILLRTLPLDGVLRAITPTRAAGAPDAGALEAIERATDLITRDLPMTRTACLKRALMRYRMMRRGGFEARFVLGVRPGGEDGFEAHAWVCLGGEPLMERDPVDYRETFSWPPQV